MSAKQIDYRIETLRAFAILFVVGSHVVGDSEMESVRGFYQYVNHSVQNVRLPLFTVISGYLYGLRPVVAGRYLSFLAGKVRRILVPLFVVSALEYLAVSLLPGVNEPLPLGDIWRIFFFPFEHYWFLQVIFIIFVVVGALDRWSLLKSNAALGVFFALTCALYLFYKKLGVSLSFFSLGTVTYLIPFFVMGYMTSARTDVLNRWGRSPVLLTLLVVGVALQQLDWFLDLPYATSKRTLVGLVIGLSGAALLIRHRFRLPVLCSVGSYAYAIYLYQGFGTSFGRRVAGLLGDMSPHLYFALVVGVAVVFGIGVEFVVKRIPRLRTLLLGLK